MTDPPSSTMAASEAAAPSRAQPQARTTSVKAPVQQVVQSLVTRDLDLTIRAFFPSPAAPMKFNPILAMGRLLRTMLKDEPSLVLRTPSNDKQIALASASLPSNESEFKKYFNVSLSRKEKQNQSHVCIGFHALSNRSLGNIKFHSSDGHLLKWLKTERVFLESDCLGTERPVTIGYFTKIDSTITHLANFRNHLANQLMLVDIDADTAVDLAPYLKTARLEAMSNGDEFVPILPAFEIYRTRISHGREPSKVSTDVLGIKCSPRDARLLGEFLTRMAETTSTDQRDGVFLPTGAVHLLGPQIYDQILKDNNFFLTTVATIPVNLEYGAWFAVIDPATTSEADPISLHEHLIRKPWFLRIESAGLNKCLIVTTKPNLPEAREWVDTSLVPLIRTSLPPGHDPPPSQLPRRLDKPVYSASRQSYAEVLKKQFSLEPADSSTSTTANNRPPRKRQAAIIDYDSDSTNSPSSTNATTNKSHSHQCTSSHISTSTPMNSTTTTTVDYAAELASLRTDLNSLRSLITTAVEQLKTEIASLLVTPASSNMETEIAVNEPPTANIPALSDLIADLKHDIATKTDISDLIVELRSDIAIIKSHPIFRHLQSTNQSPVT